ncbi:MAG TPA: ribosome biogenesis GTPase YlqF [Bacilli bacterium]|jgi:ribosome biogenesis GTPase A|nr:ribosome biogenesis GTPase YlqF [Bacilli bacterium]
MSEQNIHWFPGHMQKALRDIENKLKVIDVVVELADSRAPLYSTRNPILAEKSKNKQKLLVLTKLDLADENRVKQAVEELKTIYDYVLAGNLNDRGFIRQIKAAVKMLGEPVHKKQAAKLMKPQALKVMILGIPNVGKSTLINKLANRKAAGVENRPGLTRAQQFIKVDQDFILIDTPGVLPPNYENKTAVINLALLGSIRQEILPLHDMALFLADYLIAHYPQLLKARYDLSDEALSSPEAMYLQIAIRRGLLDSGQVNTDKAETLLLNEFKNGVLGRVSLGEPHDK